MIRRKLEDLTVISVNANATFISVDEILAVLKDKPSDTVYVTIGQRLYGIVTGGDLKRCKKIGNVTINRSFTSLSDWNYMEARKVFKNKLMIHKIPVVDEKGYLVGDFSRWDEKRWRKRLKDDSFVEESLAVHNLCLVQPIAYKKELFAQQKECFDTNNIQYISCDIDTISLYLNTNYNFIFVDEDELRGVMTSYPSLGERANKLYTYKTFMEKIKSVDICILNYLKMKGVQAYTLSCRMTGSEYEKKHNSVLQERRSIIMEDEKKAKLIPEEFAQDFLAELYTEEYYESLSSDLKFEICCMDGVVQLKDVRKKYLNIIDGERVTVAQPKDYKQTIYFFGPCIIQGSRVEDKYTIESFLQEKLNNIGKYRVVNCGVVNEPQIDINRILKTNFNKGDIAIIYSYRNCFSTLYDIQELNIWEIADNYQIPVEWSTDSLVHCNHKVNQIIANEIFCMIQSKLCQKDCEQHIPVRLDKKDYIKKSYIDKYFSDFDYTRYDKIGSIVMNCNPFTKGHRYLIEKACEMVDFLIVFVVEEDESYFSFEERFEMVQSGTSDLKKILVVPSGHFILSKTTFPEYFVKLEDEDLRKNVEYDITLFADYIASQLKINCRFVGEEPFDVVTNEYNNAMKRILPKKGIELIEIPRKEKDGVCISASMVRKYLESGKIQQAYSFVPETTKRVLEGF